MPWGRPSRTECGRPDLFLLNTSWVCWSRRMCVNSGFVLPRFAAFCSHLFICHGINGFHGSKTSVSQILMTTICPVLPTVVKPPCFYYVLTTNHCHDLPHFAPICHFSHFSWQNVSAESALIIAANRGIRRQIGALERRFSYWLRFYLSATAIYADPPWRSLFLRIW